LLPRLLAFGTTARPPPTITIVAYQNDATVACYTQAIRSVSRTHRNRGWRVPGDQPIAPVGANRELFAVARGPTLQHCHLHPGPRGGELCRRAAVAGGGGALGAAAGDCDRAAGLDRASLGVTGAGDSLESITPRSISGCPPMTESGHWPGTGMERTGDL